MATHTAPARRTKPPPSGWWFLGPFVLMLLAGAVGVGGFLSTMHEVSTRYGEVLADGEPHSVSLPTGDRAMVMVPTSGNRDDWDCRVTDDQGLALSTTDKGGNVSFGNEASSWESLLTFDPADAGDGSTATVVVACRNVEGVSGRSVLVTKAPMASAVVARIAVMVLGPLVLGGAALTWLVLLVVLQVVRRTEAP